MMVNGLQVYIFCIQEDDDDVWQTCEISQVKNMIKKLKIKICYTANDCNAIGNLELIQSKNINSFCGLRNKHCLKQTFNPNI